MSSTAQQLPLDDVTIVDFSRYAAGPVASVRLADFGAEVISIEDRAGRPADFSLNGAMRSNMHYNKQSISLDLKTEEATDIVMDLLEEADVLLHNFRPGVMERLGVGYEDVTEVNETIVYCSVTGFGEEGEYKDRPAFDPIAQAMSGLMWATGEADRKPSRIGASVMDYSTALSAALGIMIALWHRERTGEGQKIEASLFDTAATFMGYWYTYYDRTGETVQRQGHTWDMYAPVGVFETATDPIYMAIWGETMWERFCHALDREEWLDDPRYVHEDARLENREELMAEIEEIFQDYSRQELLDLLLSNNLPVSELYSVPEAAQNEHLRERGTLQTVEDVDGREVLMAASPLTFSKTPPRITRNPPESGADTENVLAEQGYTQTEIQDFEEKGVI